MTQDTEGIGNQELGAAHEVVSKGGGKIKQDQRLYYLGRVAGGVGENVLPEPAADGAVHAVRRHLLLHHHLPADPGSPAQRIASNSVRISPRVGGIRPEKAGGQRKSEGCGAEITRNRRGGRRTAAFRSLSRLGAAGWCEDLRSDRRKTPCRRRSRSSGTRRTWSRDLAEAYYKGCHSVCMVNPVCFCEIATDLFL